MEAAEDRALVERTAAGDARAFEAFDRADSNGDGSITEADRPPGTTPPPAETEGRGRRRARF